MAKREINKRVKTINDEDRQNIARLTQYGFRPHLRSSELDKLFFDALFLTMWSRDKRG